ncbi:hypothetical protein GCM10027035_44510 [Emticicia sediminis]
MKSTLIFIFFFLAFHCSFAQISLFKDINTLEAGSNPANFVEANGLVFFSVQKYDGFYLWKSDGTEAGTMAVSEQKITINTFYNLNIILPNLYQHNNEIYYQIRNASSNELWKTNGTVNTLVISNFSANQIISYNNELYLFKYNSITKVVGNTEVLVKTFLYPIAYEKVSIMNGTMYFYTKGNAVNGNSIFQVWKSDGTESETTLVKSLENIIDIYNYNQNYENRTVTTDNLLYFFVHRLRRESINSRAYWDTELWKSDGTEAGTVIVKRVLIQNNYNATVLPKNLTKFNNKVIFNEETKLWVSDGSETGTQVLKTFQYLGYSQIGSFYGILNDKFFFSPYEANENELWISDGTPTGTQLLKDLNPNGSSSPNYFVKIQNKLLFRANNNDEIWQTDGTLAGTTFLQTIPKPEGISTNNTINPEFIYTSTNQLFFKNYDIQNNYELWKSDGINTSMVKNIVTENQSSGIYDKKVKIGNVWYFNASDSRGSELWKSDGTPEGTTIVKDINLGANSTFIQEIVAVNNIIYFTAISTNEYTKRLWRSDGSENGTFEIPLNSGYPQNQGVNPEYLTAVGNKLFFKGISNQGYLWVSDGTIENTRPILNTPISANLSNLVSADGKLFFTHGGLWVSDGTQTGTMAVIAYNGTQNTPISPICLLEYHNKIYFFSDFFGDDYVGNALWESDGTATGTKIVKEFNEWNDYLTSSMMLFLEKSNNRMYFRVKPSTTSFDFWTSDGTTNGTSKLKTISLTSSQTFKFGSLNNTFFMFLISSIERPIMGWSSDGTVDGTINFIKKNFRTSTVSSPKVFNNKLYFGIDDDTYGHELWSSNGTIEGTQLVGEVRNGLPSSYTRGFMDFYDKLLFWAYDDTMGSELHYYSETTCNNNINYTVQSGNWDSPATWSCGRIPTDTDNVIIKNSHSITIPNTYRAFSNSIYTEKGANLIIQNNSFFYANPK